MRSPVYLFRALMHRLGVMEPVYWDYAVPCGVYDPARRIMWLAEVRIGGASEDVTCEVATIDAHDRWRSIMCLTAAPQRGAWVITGLTVMGKPVMAAGDDALRFTRAVMDGIRAGHVPAGPGSIGQEADMTP